jgi:hypothetical protein
VSNGTNNGHTNDSARVVQKLWSYCQLLRDDGLSSWLGMTTEEAAESQGLS